MRARDRSSCSNALDMRVISAGRAPASRATVRHVVVVAATSPMMLPACASPSAKYSAACRRYCRRASYATTPCGRHDASQRGGDCRPRSAAAWLRLSRRGASRRAAPGPTRLDRRRLDTDRAHPVPVSEPRTAAFSNRGFDPKVTYPTSLVAITRSRNARSVPSRLRAALRLRLRCPRAPKRACISSLPRSRSAALWAQ